MRTVFRTMLAAAAGAALVASGTTVVRLSAPAFADASPVAGAVADETTPRPGLVPDPEAVAEPAGPDLVVPDVAVPQPAAPIVEEQEDTEPERERAEPIRRSEPAPQTPSGSIPATVEPVPADPPTIAPVAPVAAEPTVRRAPVEREDREDREDRRDSTEDRDDPVAEERDIRPSLLGRLTEPLGVTCDSVLLRLCG